MPELLLTITTIAVLVAVAILILALGTSFIVAIFGGGPFVPTPNRAVKKILKHAKIRPHQKLYDIGAGDGRLLHFAEKLYGAKATGFEIDPFVYSLARFNQIFLRHKGKIINIEVLRFDSSVGESPYFQSYEVPFVEKRSVTNVLEYVYENLDHSLAFFQLCKRGNCGRCTVSVNGKNCLACTTEVKGDIRIEPAKNRKVVRDLRVEGI